MGRTAAVVGRLMLLAGIFALATGGLYVLASRLPPVSHDGKTLSLPSTFEEVKQVSDQLRGYMDQSYGAVLAVFSAAYLWKQTFAIPGSMFMNVLGGALLGLPAIPLVLVLNAAGATCCYLVSWMCGGPLIELVDHRLQPLRERLLGTSGNASRWWLLYELTALRLVPLVPNWLVNMASPHIGVPPHYFFWSVFLGMAPFTVISVQAGMVVQDVAAAAELLSPRVLGQLGIVAALALLPAAFSRYRERAKRD